MEHRRVKDREKPYYVDRFDNRTLVWIVLLLLFTIVDGVITIILLDGQFEEANPAMRLLVRHGAAAFLVGKYVLTAWGLPVLLIFKNYSIFHRRFRVGTLIPTFVALYVLLIIYQVGLLWFVHYAPRHPESVSGQKAIDPIRVALVTCEASRARLARERFS